MQHSYDAKFMNYADRSSRHSAQVISALLRNVLTIDSVLDVGCAKGTWLAAWSEGKACDIAGVDGSYVATDELVIPRACFVATDLSQPFDLQRTFDLVQSLEVAEHIPETAADTFLDSIVRHSRGIVLFSAAPPGQGGEFHVNEQPYDYWRRKFRKQGFDAYDYVRPQIAHDRSVSFWYRYNAMLYVRGDVADALPAAIRTTRVDASRPIGDVSPLAFRSRKLLVRALPESLRQKLARLKACVAGS